MIPEPLLNFAVSGGEALPRFLIEADHAWLRILIEEYERFDGRKVDELRERLREPLPCYAPDGKARLAMHVMDQLCRSRRRASPISPKLARSALFSTAQRSRDQGDPWDRSSIVSSAAARLGVSPEAMLESLFADLPSERRVQLPVPIPSPPELARRANLALAQGFLQRSSRVTLDVRGSARAVVRQILLQRLLCTVHAGANPGTATVEISGPYSLFRRTTLYGRALASLVPLLRVCDHFRLSADTVLRERELTVTLQSGDPIFFGAPLPSRYDSKLEERFARDFRRAAPDWDLLREPEPVRAGDHLIFPDFAIYHRRDPTRRALLEIVGFWTPRYLEAKLERVRAAAATNLILCVDDSLKCEDEACAELRHVVRFERRIDVAAVLAIVEAMADPRGPPGHAI